MTNPRCSAPASDLLPHWISLQAPLNAAIFPPGRPVVFSVMTQATLNGLPQPSTPPRRSRAGRPALPAHERIQERPTVGLYEEDRAALQTLREAGFTGKTPDVMRKALRQLAAQVEQASPEDRGRLAL